MLCWRTGKETVQAEANIMLGYGARAKKPTKFLENLAVSYTPHPGLTGNTLNRNVRYSSPDSFVGTLQSLVSLRREAEVMHSQGGINNH